MKNVVAKHVALWGRGEVYIGFWCGKLKEIVYLEDPGIDGRTILTHSLPAI